MQVQADDAIKGMTEGNRQRAVELLNKNGLKFTDFKVAYHSSTLAGMTSHLANKPVELPNDYDAVRRAIDTAEKTHTVSR